MLLSRGKNMPFLDLFSFSFKLKEKTGFLSRANSSLWITFAELNGVKGEKTVTKTNHLPHRVKLVNKEILFILI